LGERGGKHLSRMWFELSTEKCDPIRAPRTRVKSWAYVVITRERRDFGPLFRTGGRPAALASQYSAVDLWGAAFRPPTLTNATLSARDHSPGSTTSRAGRVPAMPRRERRRAPPPRDPRHRGDADRGDHRCRRSSSVRGGHGRHGEGGRGRRRLRRRVTPGSDHSGVARVGDWGRWRRFALAAREDSKGRRGGEHVGEPHG
jgi:hypothetical protein